MDEGSVLKEKNWDFFISHASEDKEAIARPLADALRRRGYRVWYDEFTLKLGDSLRRSIDRGLRDSTYGIVILSRAFFAKEWPQKELDGLNEREIDGKKVILPIWHDVSKDDVMDYSPILAGKLAAKTKDGIGHIIDMIIDVLGDDAPPVQPGFVVTDKIVRIEADRQAFVIGNSISFNGFSANCGDHVHLVIFGPGKFSKGINVANPSVSRSDTWNYKWSPDLSIFPGDYTVTVFDAENTISDEVLVRAEKGSVSISVRGTGSYYIGERINFQGICTSGKKVFLSIKGPDANLQQRKLDQLDLLCQNGNDDTFVTVDVMQDCTWSYIWETKEVSKHLEDGFYWIYAVDFPVLSDCLSENSMYLFGTISLLMRFPSIRGTVSQPNFAKGDPIIIRGTAEGVRYHEIIIWIFGRDRAIIDKITVHHDSSFTYEIPRNISKNLEEGQYFIIIQHPMLDDKFGVYFDELKQNVLSDVPDKGTQLFSLNGEGSFHGFEAVGKLISALNNSEIDDTYAKLSYSLEPPTIHFGSIDDKKQNERVVVSAFTNLSVDDEIFIDVFSSDDDLKNVKKGKPLTISKGVVLVKKGDEGTNTITFEFNTNNFPPGVYIIKASALEIEISASTSFKIH